VFESFQCPRSPNARNSKICPFEGKAGAEGGRDVGAHAEWRLVSDNELLVSSLAWKPELKSCNTNGEIKSRLAAQ
jgi:hypothetical protein